MVEGRVYQACLRHAARILPADPALEPADLCQGAYLKTLGRLDTTRSEREQIAFIRHAATQVAIDAGRRKRLVTVDAAEVPEAPDPADGPEAAALAREAEDELAARLAALGPLCGPAAALVYAGGLSYSEACAILGVRPTTLRMRLHRARGYLRAMRMTA